MVSAPTPKHVHHLEIRMMNPAVLMEISVQVQCQATLRHDLAPGLLAAAQSLLTSGRLTMLATHFLQAAQVRIMCAEGVAG